MSLATAIDQPFFRTRQSANIIKDLAQAGARSGQVFLLLGEQGVGKSRLLQEFINTDSRVASARYVQCLPDGRFRLNFDEELETAGEVLAGLDDSGLVVFDQLELASPADLETLVGFCSRSHAYRHPQIVLCGHTPLADRLRELGSTRLAGIQRADLRGLDNRERKQYLMLRGSKGNPHNVCRSRRLRQLLERSSGGFAELDRIALGSGSGSPHDPDSLSGLLALSRTQVALAGMLLVTTLLVVAGMGRVESPAEQDKTELEIQSSRHSLSLPSSESVPESVDDQTLRVASPTASLPLPAYDAAPSTRSESRQQMRAKPTGEAVAKANAADMIAQPPTVSKEIRAREKNSAGYSLVESRQQATLHWLAEQPQSAASIQILTLVGQSPAWPSLTRYLERLRNSGIDLDQVFVYSANTRQGRIHGVLYGSYKDRSDALRQIQQLPEILSMNRPIPRTVGGLRQEIAR